MTPKAKIKLAIKALQQMKQKDVAHADAARFGFEFGVKAKKRVDDIDEVIAWLEGMNETD